VFLINEGECITACSSTASSPDAVNIVFHHHWEVVIHHSIQIPDIQATLGNIRGHQNSILGVSELFEA
jgi:hypothetical protein